MPEKEIGKVAHVYDRINVAIIELSDTLKIGETVHIKGTKSDFTQTINSLQIEHKDVSEAQAKDFVGLKVDQLVHQHDKVFKVLP